MEKKRPRSREKRVTSGSAQVYKREKAKNYGGPVGHASGYSGRKQQGGSGKSGSTVKRGLFGGSGTLIVVAILYLLLGRGGNSGSSGSADILGSAAEALLGAGTSAPLTQTETQTTAYDDVESIFTVPSVQQTTTVTSTATLAGAAEATEANETVSNKARSKYTKVRGGGKDVYTIMVYMCGTDLESNYGMATSDMNEMLKAGVSEKINLIIETGGTKRWQNNIMSSSSNERYQVTAEGLRRLESGIGKRPMVDPNTLTDFINFCKKNYPADRYALIMWDHGGGSLAGYGYDELFKTAGSMPLDKFYSALDKADCKFDFIGFDACLMASLETAVACEPFADYLIASEETEPGVGWYYTDWLRSLSKNTSLPTVEIGKQIIDDFVDYCARKTPNDKTTLSITDLAEFSGVVPSALTEFAKSTSELVDGDAYRTVSNARANCREFSKENKLNQVDLIDLAKKIGTKESVALANALSDTIKYNRTSKSMTNSYGLSIYFPYQKLSGVSNMLSIYDGIGMEDSYGDCIKDFASMVSGGQVVPTTTGMSGTGSLLEAILGSGMGGYTSSGSGYSGSAGSSFGNSFGSAYGSGASSSQVDVASLLGAFLGGGDFTSITGSRSAEWVNEDLIESQIDQIAETTLDADSLVFTEKNEETVLALTEDEWELIQKIELNVFYDDGEGYIDLGLDNVYSFNPDGDLVVEYDGTWIALNGQIVPYYLIDSVEEGEAYSIRGRVPALLNDERVEIILLFDDQNPYGVVAGARRVYADGETDTLAKGLMQLQEGDVIDFLCDYYSYDGDYQASYLFGDRFIVDGGEIEISNVLIDGGETVASFCLTDLYNNSYWTPSFVG